MAARLNRLDTERVLQRIKTTQLIRRVQNHALGTLTNDVTKEPMQLTDSQLKASIFLIERTIARAEAPKDVNLSGTITLTDLIQKATQPQINGHDPEPAHE